MKAKKTLPVNPALTKMNYRASETAKMLKVEKDILKTLAYKFKDYLGDGANPGKGLVKSFTLSDIRVFAYVLMYWEENPDIENIKAGLNSNSHFDNDLIEDFINKNTPIFREVPDNVEEFAGRGAIIHSMASLADTFFIAEAYKAAGDIVVDSAIENEEAWRLVNPALYTYRHAMELYLKAVVETSERGHNLEWLMQKFKQMIADDFKLATPKWFENVVATMHEFDPGGTFFRYAETVNSDEVFVEFRHLKMKMDLVSQAFREIRNKQGLPV